MLCNYFTKFKKPIIYVNQVGGQDELVFDGSSLIVDSKDSVKRLKSFETDQDLALALLFSKSAPETSKIIKARSQILKSNECNKGVKSKISNTPIEQN